MRAYAIVCVLACAQGYAARLRARGRGYTSANFSSLAHLDPPTRAILLHLSPPSSTSHRHSHHTTSPSYPSQPPQRKVRVDGRASERMGRRAALTTATRIPSSCLRARRLSSLRRDCVLALPRLPTSSKLGLSLSLSLCLSLSLSVSLPLSFSLSCACLCVFVHMNMCVRVYTYTYNRYVCMHTHTHTHTHTGEAWRGKTKTTRRHRQGPKTETSDAARLAPPNALSSLTPSFPVKP